MTCPCKRCPGMWASECPPGGGLAQPCSGPLPCCPCLPHTPSWSLLQPRQPGDPGAPGEPAQVAACVSGLRRPSSGQLGLQPWGFWPCGRNETCSVSCAGPCLFWSSWNSWIWEATTWKCWCGEGGAIVGRAGPGRAGESGLSLCPFCSCSLTLWGLCPTCVSCGWTGTSCRHCLR